MLPLDSPIWGETNQCNESERVLPELLKRVYASPFHEPRISAVWHELWGHLYHQGDIYPASILATPHIIAAGLAATRDDLDYNVFLLPMAIEKSRVQRPHQVPDLLVDDEYNASLISSLQLIPRLHREAGDQLGPYIRSARKMLTQTKRGRFLPPQKSVASIGGLFH